MTLDYRVGRGLRRPDVNNRRQSLMKTSRLIVGLVAVGLFATACGDDSTASSNTAASGDTAAHRRQAPRPQLPPTTASR